MNDKGKYIYGVIDNKSDAIGSGLLSLNGIYAVPYQDVSAVVGDSEIIDYTNLPGDVAAKRLIGYQVVIEKLMEEFTVIPVRLGTYVLSEDEVIQALAKGYRMFKEIFEKIEGRIELDVVANWVDLNAVIKEISEEEEIKALKQAILNKKEGITVEDQIKMGMFIRSYLNKKKTEYALTIKDSLKNLCRDVKEHASVDDKTILNAAFLIDMDMRNPFEKKLEELSLGFDGKTHFKCIGPLPPYNFFMIEIKKLQYEDINRARGKLALEAFATKDDIKKAYKNCASVHHPDKQPDKQKVEAETEYIEITKAYKLLSAYCQYESCSFKREDFAGNSITVSIKE
jgi:hypothetical protein